MEFTEGLHPGLSYSAPPVLVNLHCQGFHNQRFGTIPDLPLKGFAMSRDEDMLAVIHAMRDKAIKGDISAAKLLLSYNLGKPPAAPNPDLIDRGRCSAPFPNPESNWTALRR